MASRLHSLSSTSCNDEFDLNFVHLTFSTIPSYDQYLGVHIENTFPQSIENAFSQPVENPSSQHIKNIFSQPIQTLQMSPSPPVVPSP